MADLTNLPDLTSASSSSQTGQSTQSTGSTSSGTSRTGSTSSTQSGSTSSSSSSGTSTITNAPTLSSTGGAGLTLTGLPTLAGAGIPVLEIPYTANAPFMQKSDLPEGTVFIAVGGVLAFLGACVLLWRGLIAWSINRSVRRAALASIGGSEKASAYWAGSHKGGAYTEITGGSMSMVDLTSSGKRNTFREDANRNSSTPAGLFFSPTAQATGHAGNVAGSRSSSYLPAGYYSSPSAHAGGGAGATTIGGNLAPYARHSVVNPSPPESPHLNATARPGSSYRAQSRDGPRANGRESQSHEANRRGLGAGYHNQPTGSSLMTGSTSDLAGQRAPSAYLEDLFENHGSGPRERF